MTDTDRLDYRHLPPVALIDPPERWSQTILNKGDKCRRSAYLYQRHHGGMPGHQLDRGSAFHLFAAKATILLLEHGEQTLGSIKGHIDWDARRLRPAAPAVEIVGGRRRPVAPVKAALDTVKELLREVHAERPDLTVTLADRDSLREMAYHWAAYPVVTPSRVVAVERKFVHTLPNGHTISGIIDLAEIHGDTLRVRDYKTQWDVPAWGEYEATFQGRLYAVLAIYGQPVVLLACGGCQGAGQIALAHDEPADTPCPDCEGRGYHEQLDPPIGSQVRYADVGEVYPRKLFDDGMPVRNMLLDRLQLEDIRGDLADQCESLAVAFRTGDFPAVHGSNCTQCPCEAECPLPRVLRAHAGTINTMDEAAEAAVWAEKNGAAVAATRRELREFARHHGPIRFGRNQSMEFEISEGWSSVKWPDVEAAIEEARRFGTPFELAKYRKPRTSNNFTTRTLSPAELEAENE